MPEIQIFKFKNNQPRLDIDAAGAGLGFIPIVVAGLLMIPACLYSQDAGEVVVLKNMGGSIAGYSADAGFHGKLPWQSTMQYDTRKQYL